MVDSGTRDRMTALAPSRGPLLAFLLGATAVVLACRALVSSQAFAHRPALGAIAVTLDLTVTLTALCWVTLVRGGAAPPATALAVLLGGLTLATAMLPEADRALPARLATLAAPLELLMVTRLALVARRLARLLPAAGPLPFEEAFRSAARQALGPYRLADLLAAEAGFLHMSLCSWRAAPHVPRDAVPFTVHRRAGFGAVAAAIALAGIGETVGLHLLVSLASPRAAWILTGLSIYGVTWLVGEWRALRLRPVLLRPDALEVRVGLRWRATVPRGSIRSVCVGADARGHAGAAVASPLGPPNLYLHLDAEAELTGLFGRRRRGACLGLRVDEPEALAAALLVPAPTSSPRAAP